MAILFMLSPLVVHTEFKRFFIINNLFLKENPDQFLFLYHTIYHGFFKGQTRKQSAKCSAYAFFNEKNHPFALAIG